MEVDLDEFIEIGLDINRIIKSNGQLSEYNLTLKSGDEIIVPKTDNSVEFQVRFKKLPLCLTKKV